MLDVPEVPTPPPTKLTLKERATKLFFPAKNQSVTKLPDEVTKELNTLLEIKQDLTKTGLGHTFQNNFSTLSNSELPPVMESGGQLGIIDTNEMMSDETVLNTKNSPNAPDGYILGPGFGNIVSMTLLYPERSTPKAICAVDVIPEAVVAGRMLTRMISLNPTFTDFKNNLSDNESLNLLFAEVIGEEINPTIKSRFQKTSLVKIKENIDWAVKNSWSKTDSLIPINNARIDVLGVIKKQYDLLHRMAADGNIGVAYADMTSPSTMEKIKNLPGFAERKNVLYMSNAIDHLTERGTNLTRLNSFDVLKTLGEEKNIFVDTTQRSLNYNLRVSEKVPQYMSSDVKMTLR